MAEAEIKNIEDWFAQATDDERLTYLKDRLVEAQAQILEQAHQIKLLKGDRKLLHQLLLNHQHDGDKILIPGGFVKFMD